MSTVNALRSVKNSFTDPYRNLRNWNRGDPCTKNWTGVICHNLTPTDGYLHITELYDFYLEHTFFFQASLYMLAGLPIFVLLYTYASYLRFIFGFTSFFLSFQMDMFLGSSSYQDDGEPNMNKLGVVLVALDSKYQVYLMPGFILKWKWRLLYFLFKNRLLLDKNLSGTLSPELGRFSYMKILWVPYTLSPGFDIFPLALVMTSC